MPIGVSTAGLLQKNGKYLMARRKPGGAIGGLWEFPGGKAETGETPEEALAREWREELDAEITVGRLFFQGEFRHGEKPFQLLAYPVETESNPSPGPEHGEIGWFHPAEMLQLGIPESDRLVVEELIRCTSRRGERHSLESR